MLGDTIDTGSDRDLILGEDADVELFGTTANLNSFLTGGSVLVDDIMRGRLRAIADLKALLRVRALTDSVGKTLALSVCPESSDTSPVCHNMYVLVFRLRGDVV